MAGRVSYLGQRITRDLILDLDAGKKDSYDRVGNNWNDLAYKNNATLTSYGSSTWENSILYPGGAVTFNGANNWVSVPHQSYLSFGTSQFTLNVWFIVKSLNGYQTIICKPGNSDYNGWNLYFETGNTLGFIANDGAGGAWKLILADGFIPSVNTWYNYTITRSGSSWVMYRNGVSVSTASVSVTISDVGNPINIGRYLNFPGGVRYFNGSIALAQLYSRALSSAEVLSNFNTFSRRFSSTIFNLLVEYLIVAGGAGGGAGSGGGGGAGGLLTGQFQILTGVSYTLSIGAGGSGGLSRNSLPTNGSNSSAFGLTATGGGYGAGAPCSGLLYNANSGGSGGGGGHWCPPAYSAASGIAGQGFGGGSAVINAGGGGGGAGGPGGNNTIIYVGGFGGIGTQSSITGQTLYYSGGGGGGGAGPGGTGGGGTGGSGNDTFVDPTKNGQTNTGGGAGGGNLHAGSLSGNGGSGVVVVAYPDTYPALIIGVGLTYNQPTRSGYRVYRFTAGAGTIRI